MSRANRRAERRLAEKMAKYEQMKSSDKFGGKGFTKPGSLKKW